MSTSHRFLKFLAALTWYGGAVALAIKGVGLLWEAQAQKAGPGWVWLALAIGLAAGLVKGATLFSFSCKRNLDRIDGLSSPKLWQFFRPRFFLFLALMVSLSALLSGMAHGHHISLLAVGALDLSIATALFGSSYVFWKERKPQPCNPSI